MDTYILTVCFSMVRQLFLVDFQLIPTASLDFQIAVNLGETTPLSDNLLGILNEFPVAFGISMLMQIILFAVT